MTNDISVINSMALAQGMNPKEYELTVRDTCGCKNATLEQFHAFLLVAREYGLNPLVKEIYAFPAKTGGITPIVSGEIADDLAQYFLESEQKPTAFALAERLEVDGVRAAGGWLIQALPGADDAALARLEARIAQAPPLSQALAGGATPEAIVGDLFGGTTVEILETYPVRVYCPCERERFERVLIGLGRAELEDMAQSQAATELVCHFCNTRYFFSATELHALGAEA
jgi:molecular chaperone Hsp33